MAFLDRIRKFGSRVSRAEGGSTAVEFAMVIGPFLVIVLAIIEVALAYSAEISIDNGLRDAARIIRLGSAQHANMTASAFKTSVCAQIPAYMGCGSNLIVDVRAFDTFAQAAVNMPKPLAADGTIDPTFAQFSMGGPAQVVVVSLYFDWKLYATLPPLGSFPGHLGIGLGNMPDGSRLITAMTAFRSETYP